jgi:phosphoribosyl 1,2-cyclic phosphodiesterase
VTVVVGHEDPIILDLGTGLRCVGDLHPVGEPFDGTALVTHIHWDHVQGLPFFRPLHMKNGHLQVYGPKQEEGSLSHVFGDFMRPPYFPVHFSQLAGDVTFHDVVEDDLAIGNAKVSVRPVPHCGPTVGYRIEWDGAVVTYISDHQAPLSLDTVSEPVLELCDGADLLIHDAQYTPPEFRQKSDWGHCTVDYAVLVAKEAGAKALALFHHDPAHDDDAVDQLLIGARETSARLDGPEVIAAAEGLTIDL